MSISRRSLERFSAGWAAISLFLPHAEIEKREVHKASAKSAEGFSDWPTIED